MIINLCFKRQSDLYCSMGYVGSASRIRWRGSLCPCFCLLSFQVTLGASGEAPRKVDHASHPEETRSFAKMKHAEKEIKM